MTDYNQPFGAAANAPYINGNPAAGIQGSIFPAAGMENPQRELVNFIADTGQTPNNANLRQLGLGVQGGRTNFNTAGGTANSLTLTLAPVPAALTPGMRVWFRVAAATTSTSVTLNVNGIGAKPIKTAQGGNLPVGELQPGMNVGVMYDQPTDTWVIFSVTRGANSSGFDTVKQPAFWARSSLMAIGGGAGFFVSGFTVVYSNLGDASFSTSNGHFTVGSNTAGLWAFFVSNLSNNTVSDAMNIQANAVNAGVVSGLLATTTADINAAGGFSPYNTLSYLAWLESGQQVQTSHQVRNGGYSIQTRMGGVRVAS
jgi:hypothetical protein